MSEKLSTMQVKAQQGAKNIQTIANPVSRLESLKEQLNPESLKIDQNNNQLLWGGFYKKTFQERLDQVLRKAQIKKLDPEIAVESFETGGLSLSRAELMVENCIGKLSVPMGLGLNFLVNNVYYTVPMVVEEPSVIAAASSSAKFIADNGGGFQTYSTQPVMIGQIQILNADTTESVFKIERSKQEIIAKGNEVCQKLVGRGGGVVDVKTKILKNNEINHINFRGENDMLVVELLINVCDIMGANVINTILEHVAPMVVSVTGGRLGIRILSNLCTERRAYTQFSIPVKSMAWKQSTGEEVAKGILEAYRFAQLDPFRATTHNKGIMNGIDAVALATGQDWRAIEAAAHAFCYYKHGRYQPLSHYEIVTLGNGERVFRGSLEIPISVGSKGGVLESNPLYKNSFRLLRNPDSKTLGELIVSVGLAQNFGALRALVIEGIQKGHMALHARNIALSAGVPTYLVDEAARYMKLRGNISLESAKQFIEAHNLFSTLRTAKESEEKLTQKPLSTFLVEIRPTSMEEPIQLHVAFDCWTSTPIHLSIEKNKPKSIAQSKESMQIQQLLFGSKEYDWLDQIFQLLEIIRVDYKKQKSSESSILVEPNKVNRNVHIYKLKLTAIMVSLLSMSLVKKNKEKISFIFQNSQQESHTQKLFDTQEILIGEPEDMKYGLSLLCELIRLFKFHVHQSVENPLLKQSLLNELYHVIESNIFAWDSWNLTKANIFNFEKFLILRKKRLSASLILLCDLIDSQVNQEDLQMIKNLGDIFEIQATVARDLNRWNSIIDCNLYSYWLVERNLVHRGTEKSVHSEFVHSVSRDFLETKKKQLIKGSKEMLKKHIGSETLLKIIANTGNVIQEYYKFKDAELMAKPGL